MCSGRRRVVGGGVVGGGGGGEGGGSEFVCVFLVSQQTTKHCSLEPEHGVRFVS